MKKALVVLLAFVLCGGGLSAAFAPQADLIIKKVYLSPKDFQPEDDVVLIIKVANKGKADSVPCEVLVIYDNEKTYEDMDAIAAKGKDTISVELTLNDGLEHSFYIKLDAKTKVSEGNKLNNKKNVTFKVKPKAKPTPIPVTAEEEEEEVVPEDAALPVSEEEEAKEAEEEAAEKAKEGAAGEPAAEKAEKADDDAEEAEDDAEEAEDDADEAEAADDDADDTEEADDDADDAEEAEAGEDDAAEAEPEEE